MRDSLPRRAFLGGAAAAAAAIALPRTATASARVTEDRRRAVVIGTGFGGGVTAMRLGQAGVATLVLERGIRWPTGPNADTFPRMFSPDKRSAWLDHTPALTGSSPAVFGRYTGVVERLKGRGMDIFCGAGVGGGSLSYHGMTLQPSAEGFAMSMPSAVEYEPMAARPLLASRPNAAPGDHPGRRARFRDVPLDTAVHAPSAGGGVRAVSRADADRLELGPSRTARRDGTRLHQR